MQKEIEEIKKCMKSLPEIDWNGKHKKSQIATNRLLCDMFPHIPQNEIRRYRLMITQEKPGKAGESDFRSVGSG